VAGRLLPTLPGSSGAEKLDIIRRAMTESTHSPPLDALAMITKEAAALIEKDTAADNEESDEYTPMPAIIGIGKAKDRWDVETVLSAYMQLI
jgi:hypothetical protein